MDGGITKIWYNKKMNEQFKKLTEEVRSTLEGLFQKSETQQFIEQTKAAEDGGTFECIISTADIDRQGESIQQDGWDLSFYLQNPIVLWAHDYSALPIGVCESVSVVDGKLVAKGRFAPESANPFAQQVRRLYDAGIVRATSVGFIVKKATGNIITEAQLLEFSFVPVPANPYALSLSKAKELGIDREMLAMKGLDLQIAPEEKAPEDEPQPDAKPEAGDPCKLEDGTNGQYEADESGALICKPIIEEKPKAAEEPATEAEPTPEAGDAGTPDDSQAEMKAAALALDEAIKAAVNAYEQKTAEIAAKSGKKEALPAGSEEEVGQEIAAPKQRSSSIGFDDSESLDDFLSQQKTLRLVNYVTSQALRSFNERTRGNSKTYGRKRKAVC